MLVNKSIFSEGNGNALRLSSVCQTEQPVHFQSFSAKCVVSGNEKYTLNNRKVVVREGEYVIGNKNTTSSVLIDTISPARGICIDIAKEYISEIIAYHYQNPTAFSHFLFDQEWVVQKYTVSNSSLGYALHQLAMEFENLNTGFSKVNNELFFTIAECIVNDQSAIFQNFSQLKTVKQETTGRLFTYVYDAKNYIDEHFLQKISIAQMAAEAKLSEYHFIRLFKTVFSSTPYQYLLQKRLSFAKELLQQRVAIQEVAFITSFADSASFCKAFKSAYGFTPKQFANVN